jgi:hypothetical protein
MTDTFPNMPARLERVEGLPAGNKRGKALERLVSEMLAAVPGVTIAASNVIPGTGQAEFDIVLTNKTPPDGLDGLDGFGRDVLVECKSSDAPLGSRDVTHFLNQARTRHSDWSILVSLAGITGDGDDVAAANSVVHDFANRDNVHIVLISRVELAAIRSANHFANVLVTKRSQAWLDLRAAILPIDHIAALDPDPPHGGGVKVERGLEAFRRAVRRMHDERLIEVLDRADELAADATDETLRENVKHALDLLERENLKRGSEEDPDPFFRDVRARIVDVGAAFANLLDDELIDKSRRRELLFDVRETAPQRLRAHSATELWDLMSDYRFRKVSQTNGWERYSHVTAMLAMVVEEMLAIDDIDPADIYGHETIGP